jgi:hypothetical protein
MMFRTHSSGGNEMVSVLAFAFLAAAQPAGPARDWQEVGESDQGSRLAYDRASIRLDRAAMVASFDYRLRREDSYRIARVELRCAERTARVVRTTHYTPEGVVLASDEAPSHWEPVPAESSFQIVAGEACGPPPETA